MIYAAQIAVSAALGALGRRTAGGLSGDLGHPLPGGLAKLAFGFLAACPFLSVSPHWVYPLVAIGIYCGHSIHGVEDTRVGSRMWFLWSGLYALQVSLPAAIAAYMLGFSSPWLPLVLPPLLWTGYMIGMRIASVRILTLADGSKQAEWRFGPVIGPGMPFGELFAGAALGALTAVTVL